MKSIKDSLPSFIDVTFRFITFISTICFTLVFVGVASLLYVALTQDVFPWYWNIFFIVGLLSSGYLIIESLRNFFKSPS